jgi:hypothetical protein
MQFRVHEWTSFEDVAQWDCAVGDDVEFRIKRDSGFQLFTTGAAIAALQRVRSKASIITISSEFSFSNRDINELTMAEWPSFFLTLGGIALLHAADRVIDVTGADFSRVAFDAMWRQIILRTSGIIGDGKSQNLISREFDSPIPEAVRSSETNRIPSRTEFELVLGKLGAELGGGKKFFASVTEAAISSFLFEAFRNAIEHAQSDSEGIWGVWIEKVVLMAADEVSRRKQIPEFVRDFVERRRRRYTEVWICVSVADYGFGIQRTLPPLADESEWARLLRAFERDTSRKPKSGSPDRGQGLPNVVDAAGRLNACVFVNSTGIGALYDSNSASPAWSQIAVSPGLRGTSISVLWPISKENPDQETLELGV